MLSITSKAAPSMSRLMTAASVSIAAAAAAGGGFGTRPFSSCEGDRPVALAKDGFTALTVSKNEVIGKDVHKVTLDFPDKESVLGMTTAGMLMVEGDKRDGSGAIARPYTPVSRNDLVGQLELVVKDYPGVGNVSSHVCRAAVGSSLAVKGCFTKIAVTPNKWKRIGMIAGGSGLTPVLQVAEELLSHPEDKTEMTLLFCNTTPEHIFLKEHLDGLAARSGGRFRVHYVVDAAPAGWEGPTGYVDEAMAREYLPAPDGDDNMIMVCGPPPMYAALCGPKAFAKGKPPAQGELKGVLKGLGFTESSVFKF